MNYLLQCVFFLDKQCERSEIFVSQRQSKQACEYGNSNEVENHLKILKFEFRILDYLLK